MWSTSFPGCKKSAAISSSCCATNWSSIGNTSANAETTCRKSATGLGLIDERACSQLRIQQPEELSVRNWQYDARRSAGLHLGGQDRMGWRQDSLFDQELPGKFPKRRSAVGW